MKVIKLPNDMYRIDVTFDELATISDCMLNMDNFHRRELQTLSGAASEEVLRLVDEIRACVDGPVSNL